MHGVRNTARARARLKKCSHIRTEQTAENAEGRTARPRKQPSHCSRINCPGGSGLTNLRLYIRLETKRSHCTVAHRLFLCVTGCCFCCFLYYCCLSIYIRWTSKGIPSVTDYCFAIFSGFFRFFRSPELYLIIGLYPFASNQKNLSVILTH